MSTTRDGSGGWGTDSSRLGQSNGGGREGVDTGGRASLGNWRGDNNGSGRRRRHRRGRRGRWRRGGGWRRRERQSSLTVVGAVDGSTSTSAVVVALLLESTHRIVSVGVSVMNTGGAGATDKRRSSGNSESGLHDVRLFENSSVSNSKNLCWLRELSM